MRNITSQRFFLATLLFILAAIFSGCTRTYKDGATEEIGAIQKAYDIIVGLPARKDLKEEKILKLTGDKVKDKIIIATNKKIEEVNEGIRAHNKAAAKDRENPDEGLIPILQGLATILGVGGAAKFALNKRAAEALRIEVEHESNILKGRIQAIKEVHRGDSDALEKIKRASAIGADIARDSKAELVAYKNDIEKWKALYNGLFKKKVAS